MMEQFFCQLHVAAFRRFRAGAEAAGSGLWRAGGRWLPISVWGGDPPRRNLRLTRCQPGTYNLSVLAALSRMLAC